MLNYLKATFPSPTRQHGIPEALSIFVWKADSGTHLHQAKHTQQEAANSSSVLKATLGYAPENLHGAGQVPSTLGTRVQKGLHHP